MSWDAHLVDDRGHTEGDWNYTHNTNGMIAVAYRAVTNEEIPVGDGPLGPAIGPVWWRTLDGMYGPSGKRFLHTIIMGLEADPELFRAMDPGNGWGDYEGILRVLKEMRDAVPDWPTTWRASG